MYTKNMLIKRLADLGITIKIYHHEPMYTVEQGMHVSASIPGVLCKNLFLKDKKNRLWLIVALHDTTISLKHLAKKIGAPELRFASPELLMQYLGVLPGSVTPLAIINDITHVVSIVVDDQIMHQGLLQVHPLQNDATVTISPNDLIAFINHCGNRYELITLPTQ